MAPIVAAHPYARIDDFSDARPRWLAGLCPCCGMPADLEHVDGTEAEAIAEGVIICGRCVANRHMDGPVRSLMVAALLP
jgi:hypothetical protein